MKSWLVIFFAVGLVVNVKAQAIPENQVPSAVVSTFRGKFTNVTELKWELKGDLYKAEFKVGKRGHDVWIDKTGKITKQKEDFPKKDLPPVIQQQLANEFKAYKLDDADKIEMDGKIFYQVDLEGSTEDRKILFSADGKIQENTID